MQHYKIYLFINIATNVLLTKYQNKHVLYAVELHKIGCRWNEINPLRTYFYNEIFNTHMIS